MKNDQGTSENAKRVGCELGMKVIGFSDGDSGVVVAMTEKHCLYRDDKGKTHKAPWG